MYPQQARSRQAPGFSALQAGLVRRGLHELGLKARPLGGVDADPPRHALFVRPLARGSADGRPSAPRPVEEQGAASREEADALTPPLRPCLGCGRPGPGSRCPSCSSAKTKARDATRGSTTERGYGAEHRSERANWAPLVSTGTVTCRRAPFGLCVADDPVIRDGDEWHLGHPDAACPSPKAPEHAVCNTTAPHRHHA